MNRMKKETVIAVTFILCVTMFFVCLVPRWYSSSKLLNQYKSNDVVAINWEKRYPFKSAVQDNSVNENSLVRLQTRYLSLVTWIKSKISLVVTNGTIARYPISELYCKLQKTIGYKRFESKDFSVLVLKNDTYSYQAKADNKLNNTTIVESISEFHQWLNSLGIKYLYVMEPCKISPVNEDNIYEGYVDHQKYNMSTLAALMEQSEIPFLNLQEKAVQMGDVNKLFYRTDHHWKPSTALWAARIVAENLNENFECQIDLSRYDTNKFLTKDYGARFLGSQGKKATLGVAEPDNFELILPAYNTELHVTVENLDIDKTGTFEETLIDQSQLREENYPYNYYILNEYSSYGYGEQPLITVENNHVSNDLKVLILRDSYVDCMGSFFSLGVYDLTLVDLRYFTGSIRIYIQELKPDVVITMLNGGNGNLGKNYESHTNIVDYR